MTTILFLIFISYRMSFMHFMHNTWIYGMFLAFRIQLATRLSLCDENRCDPNTKCIFEV